MPRLGAPRWQHQNKGREYIERCTRALVSGKPLEVILVDGHRQGTGEPKKVYVLEAYYAVRISYVGTKETGDYGVRSQRRPIPVIRCPAYVTPAWTTAASMGAKARDLYLITSAHRQSSTIHYRFFEGGSVFA